jgi:hypothetical protein
MFQCRLCDASQPFSSSAFSPPSGSMVNRLTARWPPSWSPYSSSTVHGWRASIAFLAGAYLGSSGSRKVPCQKPMSPTGMYRSRFCRSNSSS